ncbi:site-specific integrase (plasmid) [Sulfolobus tengchongensis]|uniref:Site-specific integrase n=1 Tax=Sulfolobus tengchongensis TaxID=207809 RepID=A0AAX4L423_9CREN
MIDIKNIDDNMRRLLLKKAYEKLGSSIYEKLQKSRRTIYVYIRGYDERGREIRIPDEVVEKVVNLLPLDEVYEVLEGFSPRRYTVNDIIGILSRVKQDPEFREVFFMLLSKTLGDYLNTTTSKYIVTSDDIELFKKKLREKSKKTASDRLAYLTRALADLNYQLSAEDLNEYLLEVEEESKGKAEHIAKALKLFIKEVVRLRSPQLARELYDSFKTPRSKTQYKPPPLDLDILMKIYENISDLAAKSYFRLLVETGLRTGELFVLTVEHIDLEKRVINIMKENQTKRAYISFLHVETANWLKEKYLPYRNQFVEKYFDSVKNLALIQEIDLLKWKNKLFPFREDRIREEIKEAMDKVGVRFRLYDVRSFFASYLAKQGVSPLIINILQGRAPPQQFKILQDHYFVISLEELQRIYDEKAPKLA